MHDGVLQNLAEALAVNTLERKPCRVWLYAHNIEADIAVDVVDAIDYLPCCPAAFYAVKHRIEPFVRVFAVHGVAECQGAENAIARLVAGGRPVDIGRLVYERAVVLVGKQIIERFGVFFHGVS